MGGRGSISGTERFGAKLGVRLSPKQYKGAVSDEANMIFREIQAQPALQLIVHKSFKNGVTIITVNDNGLNDIRLSGDEHNVEMALSRLAYQFEASAKQYTKDRHNTATWSGYDTARAKNQANIQAAKTLRDLIKKLKT